jgi:hypothetical protein
MAQLTEAHEKHRALYGSERQVHHVPNERRESGRDVKGSDRELPGVQPFRYFDMSAGEEPAAADLDLLPRAAVSGDYATSRCSTV